MMYSPVQYCVLLNCVTVLRCTVCKLLFKKLTVGKHANAMHMMAQHTGHSMSMLGFENQVVIS